MCLAVPLQISQIDGFEARCSAKGVERTVDLFMLQGEPIDVGNWVLVHSGYAIRTISADEAQQSWALFDQLFEES